MGNLSVRDAQTCVLEHAVIRDVEVVKLEASLGRVLAEEIRANRDQPPYDEMCIRDRLSDMEEVYPQLPHFALDDISGLADFLLEHASR